MQSPPESKPTAIEVLAKFDSTVLAGLVFLALGGGIISFYYAHIRYLPDIEWSTSIVHLATATLIGGGLAILFALSLFLPGCIWSAFLLRDDELQEEFYFQNSDEICLRTLWENIGYPFTVVITLSHVVLFAAELISQVYLSYFYLGGSAILLYMVGVAMKDKLERLISQSPPSKETGRRLFKYITWFLISIVLSQMSMLLIHLFSGRPTGRAFWITTFFCTVGVLVSNHFVAIHIPRNRVLSALVALVITALLLYIADRNSVLSVQVLAFFGLGERSATVDLVLNDEGQMAKRQLDLVERCTADNAANRLCDVQVLSRLGNEYLLKATDQCGKKENDRIFSFPKSAVISRISRPVPSPSPSP
jgi:hypothetical protein